MAKLIIAGGRDFDDYSLLDKAVSKLDTQFDKTDGLRWGYIREVVSGHARGADRLGEKWADKNLVPVKQFIPDWDYYGSSAGIKRNEEMGDYADELLAFWDLQSSGTKHMIEYMKKLNKPVTIVVY